MLTKMKAIQQNRTPNTLSKLILTEDTLTELLAINLIHSPYDLVIGEGLGATFALIIGRALGCRTILISPLYPINQCFSLAYPNYKHQKELSMLEQEVICKDSDRISLKNIFAIVGGDDSIVDTKDIRNCIHEGNCVYVPGDRPLSGGEFSEAFKMLASSSESDSDTLRERIKHFNENHLECNPQEREKLPIRITGVDGSSGNITINWKYDTKPRIRTLFLYYENGEWFKDTNTGDQNPDEVNKEIIQKALPILVANAKATPHKL